MFRALIVVLCCAPVIAVWSSELRIDDLRLAYGYMPDSGSTMRGRADHTASDGSIDEHTNDDLFGHHAEPRRRASLGWYWSLRELEAGRGSLLLGVEAIYDTENTSDTKQWSTLGDLFIGWAWPLSPAWDIEEGFLIGAGRQRSRTGEANAFSDGATAHFAAAAFAYEYGARLGVRWTSPWRVQAGLDIAYLVMSSKPHYSDTHDVGSGVIERFEYRPIYRQEGFAGALVLGFRL